MVIYVEQVSTLSFSFQFCQMLCLWGDKESQKKKIIQLYGHCLFCCCFEHKEFVLPCVLEVNKGIFLLQYIFIFGFNQFLHIPTVFFQFTEIASLSFSNSIAFGSSTR